jgi:hypothetical protein
VIAHECGLDPRKVRAALSAGDGVLFLEAEHGGGRFLALTPEQAESMTARLRSESNRRADAGSETAGLRAGDGPARAGRAASFGLNGVMPTPTARSQPLTDLYDDPRDSQPRKHALTLLAALLVALVLGAVLVDRVGAEPPDTIGAIHAAAQNHGVSAVPLLDLSPALRDGRHVRREREGRLPLA